MFFFAYLFGIKFNDFLYHIKELLIIDELDLLYKNSENWFNY